MKYTITLFLLLPVLLFSQSKSKTLRHQPHPTMNHHSIRQKTVSDTTNDDPLIYKPLSLYIAGFGSVSSGDTLKLVSYPSAEIGICYKNLSVGLNGGRNNFDFTKKDNAQNYYLEIKTTVSSQIGCVKGYLIFGYGMYMNSQHNLIEFGSGITYSISNIDLSIQVSNFDRTDYISLGIARNFYFKKKKV
jgi:hypothetical protein